MKWVPFALVVLLAVGRPADAQQHPELAEAVRLSTEGMGDSARTLARAVLNRYERSDSVYAEALFTLGVVSDNLDEAQRALQSLVVEFSLSPWADRALLRLIQLSQATGDPGASVGWLERLRRDYPFSDQLADAAFWGARAYFELGNEVRGCQVLDEGLASVAENVELRTKLAFYAQRCAASERRADSAAADNRAYFTVQVLAAKNVALVDAMLSRLHEEGFEGIVAPRDAEGLLRVRVGRLASRPEAERLAREIRQKVGQSGFVVEVKP